MNLAFLWGALRMILVGFDMGPIKGKDHFFGDHPKTLKRDSPYQTMRRNFDVIASELAANSIRVVNCSEHSHLTCFPKMTLAEACNA